MALPHFLCWKGGVYPPSYPSGHGNLSITILALKLGPSGSYQIVRSGGKHHQSSKYFLSCSIVGNGSFSKKIFSKMDSKMLKPSQGCVCWEAMEGKKSHWLMDRWWIVCVTQAIIFAFCGSNPRAAPAEQPSSQGTGKSKSSEKCTFMCRNNGDF